MVVKNPHQETLVLFLSWEDPLEEEVATHSSILAWEIPWAEEPGGLQSTSAMMNLNLIFPPIHLPTGRAGRQLPHLCKPHSAWHSVKDMETLKGHLFS